MKKLVSLVLVGLFVVVAAGCGTSTNTLSEVRVKGTIQFAMSGGYPPFNYYNDQGELVGFDIEIGEEIASRLGVSYEPVPTDWDGIIGGLLAGSFDGVLGSMGITEARQESVDFSDPYYYSGAQLVVRNDSSITDPAQVTPDMRIAVVTGTTFADQVVEWGAEPVYYDSDAITLMELNSGNVDRVITDRLVALINSQEHGYDFNLVGEMLYTETMAIAFRPGDDDLREAVNEALAEMRADGTYQEISQRYFDRDIGIE